MPRFVSRDVRSWLMLVSSIRFLCSISPSIPFLRRLQNPRYSCFSHLYCFFFLLLLLLLYCGLSEIKSGGGFLICSFFFFSFYPTFVGFSWHLFEQSFLIIWTASWQHTFTSSSHPLRINVSLDQTLWIQLYPIKFWESCISHFISSHIFTQLRAWTSVKAHYFVFLELQIFFSLFSRQNKSKCCLK